MTAQPFIEAIGWIIAGLALGAVYLWLIGRTVEAILPRSIKPSAYAYVILRLALAGAALWFAASHGALPLLLMLLGFLVARTIVIRRLGGIDCGG